MDNKLRDCALRAIEEFDVMFAAENITSAKQEWLVEQCLVELRPLLKTPEKFFAGSLSGQKLFDQLYTNAGLPKSVQDERLEGPFQLLFPRVADRFCAYLPLVAELKATGDRETLRRFDGIEEKLAQISTQIQEFAQQGMKGTEQHFARLHKLILSRVLGKLAVSGLHGERPYEVSLDDIFVLPALERQVNGQRDRIDTAQAVEEKLFIPGARYAVEGHPGGGKTTWTNWLQQRALKRITAPVLAVQVRFRDYARGELPDLHELLRQATDVHLRKKLTDQLLEEWIAQSRVVFLLDGFDEVAPPRRDEVGAWITGLAASAIQAPIILTSRPLSTDHLKKMPDEWQQWQLVPFDQKQVETYIRLWHRCCPFLLANERSVDTAALARQWHGDPTLRNLTGNPLMLATLLTVHHRDGQSLPRGRAKLYQRYLNGMLGIWEESIKVERTVKLTPDQKRGILQRFALHFHLHDIESLAEVEENGGGGMLALTAAAMKELSIKSTGGHPAGYESLVLSELRERTGMLDGPGTYSFVHKSVAEFLFAEVVNEGHLLAPDGQKLDRHWLQNHRTSDRWKGVLSFWTGIASIGDFQGFVEPLAVSMDDQDRLLALGMVHDQLERMPVLWSKQQLFAIQNRAINSPYKGWSTWVTNYVPESIAGEAIMPMYVCSNVGLQKAYGDIVDHLSLSLLDVDTDAQPWSSYAWGRRFEGGLASIECENWRSLRARPLLSFPEGLKNLSTLQSSSRDYEALYLYMTMEAVLDLEPPIDTTPPILVEMLERTPRLKAWVSIIWVSNAVSPTSFQIQRQPHYSENLWSLMQWAKHYEPPAEHLAQTRVCISTGEGHIDSLHRGITALKDLFATSSPEHKLKIQEMLDYLIALLRKRDGESAVLPNGSRSAQ